MVVATALTACGIETLSLRATHSDAVLLVATALTACGIETNSSGFCLLCILPNIMLQQRLPLAVLKRSHRIVPLHRR